ncbi:MAG TPA: winged helix-turn-helix domain-containing protein [Candidatus Acidoferrum sp.]|nr:winged helix-turn-helix domain-containing protein [Candidatus Acidoferrum sp.]
MEPSSPNSRRIAFDRFEADLLSGELRKDGRRIRLQAQPFQLLALLLEHPGEVVTREEVCRNLWKADTFVDFDHSLGTAINKIREALNDSAENPRFIETLPRRGYRFIGQITENGNGSVPVAADPTSAVKAPSSFDSKPPLPLRGQWPRFSTLALVAPLTLLAAFVGYLGWRRAYAVRSSNAGHVMLAVLPFENLSGSPNEDYFSDGLTEEIITQLGALSPDQLGVIARTTSMAYKRTSKSAQQIARELGVDYILESSVRRDGEQVRISAQLIRTADQVHVWARSYDRNISHSIALQEEVARAVAEQIRIKLSPAYNGPASPQPLDEQANEAYLRGRYFGNQFTVVGYGKAIAYFQQAIDRQASFAEAYSGLADSYYFLVVTDAMSPRDGESKAQDAAHQAVALGEGLAESHNAMGSVMLGLWDWSQAETEFKRAIELNPSYSTEHRLYAALLVTLRRHEEAWQQINQAMRLDPLSLPNNAEVVRTLYYARDYDRAVEHGRKALQLNPDYYRTHFWLARVYAQKGLYEEAIAESKKVLEAMPDSTAGLTELAYSLAAGGRQSEARRILQRLKEKSKRDWVPAYNLAVIHVALTEKEAALNYLQQAYLERDWAMMVLAVEPRLDPLRGNSGFQELLGKCRLAL